MREKFRQTYRLSESSISTIEDLVSRLNDTPFYSLFSRPNEQVVFSKLKGFKFQGVDTVSRGWTWEVVGTSWIPCFLRLFLYFVCEERQDILLRDRDWVFTHFRQSVKRSFRVGVWEVKILKASCLTRILIYVSFECYKNSHNIKSERRKIPILSRSPPLFPVKKPSSVPYTAFFL